ncbi:hypothetical protein [Acidomonas methanolica]|uniref:hypothetical protein n=1 Tax=Acidomonas methanolica TaxID=437 RepID=UPI002119D508|nr:hypothetical protein [Acidomonas methanolica]MCQ9157224.1 hypothetical protein [Acidomonas methanolica]
MDWFNNRRILVPISNITPAEAEQQFYATLWTQSSWPRNLCLPVSVILGTVQAGMAASQKMRSVLDGATREVQTEDKLLAGISGQVNTRRDQMVLADFYRCSDFTFRDRGRSNRLQ